MVLRIDELVAPRIGVDERLDIGWGAARGRHAKLRALVCREYLVKPRLHPLYCHGRTLIRSADNYANEVVGRTLIALLERDNALLVKICVVGYEVRRNLDDVGKLRRVVERRRENAVEGGKIVATRIKDDAALRAGDLPRKRLRGVESAGARSYNDRTWLGRLSRPFFSASLRLCVKNFQPLQKPHSPYAKPIKEIAKHLVERRLEFHRHKLEVESQCARKRL